MYMDIYFKSKTVDQRIATEEYKSIWSEDKNRIVEAWESITDLAFQEEEMEAVIHDGKSQSHPLLLRDRYDIDRKKSVLVHELGHILLQDRVDQKEFTSLENHKTLFLVLYEVWTRLYGEQFAQESVDWESKVLGRVYKEAWEWALSFSKEERLAEFEKRKKE